MNVLMMLYVWTLLAVQTFSAEGNADNSPQAVSRKLSEQLLSTQPENYNPQGYRGYVYEPGGKWVNYAVWSLWANCLANARLTGDRNLEQRLVDLFEPFYGPKKKVLSPWRHVDFTVQGALPLEIARLRRDPKALKLGLSYADIQWAPPGKNDPNPPYNATPFEERQKWYNEGYTDQTRFWIDDMYMITFLQSQAYLATGDRKFIDRAARELVLYLGRLQRPNGLFYHAEDVPYVWGRGCGWMAAAMPMLLKYLPEDSEYRPGILDAYRKTMAALLENQHANGLWGQIVDDPEAWDETSGSAMFAYAFNEGAKHGWIDPEVYGPAALKAYYALVAKLDEYGNLPEVCCGTGAFNSRDYYLKRDRVHGDPHGQAALAWLCRSLMEKEDARPLPLARRVPEPWQDLVWGDPELVNRPADGFCGIWYMNQPTKDEYRFKYSGGMGSYCAGHLPMAVYSKEKGRTYFCYGGTDSGNTTLYHCISYFDHKTGALARPMIVIDKHTTDAHDNPVISVDDDGYIWMFSASHGTQRPSCISRSVRPHDISEFEIVRKGNFSYPQPHWIPGKGFLFLETVYKGVMSGRSNCFETFDAMTGTWSEPQQFAFIEEGNYLRSWQTADGKVGVAFDRHPKGKGLNWRTDIYYLETDDMGRTWKTAAGETVTLPVTETVSPARALKMGDSWRNIYIKGVRFDKKGHPYILYVTSKGAASGPDNDPREWKILRWTGSEWQEINTGICGDNNYDFGTLYIENSRNWRILAATGRGPQPWNPGGEIQAWRTRDAGRTWSLEKQLTQGSVRNMNYTRTPLYAHPDFIAFWADGNGRDVSESHFYYCDSNLNVHEMPFGSDFRIRDPFILEDEGSYYLYDSQPHGAVKGVFARQGYGLWGWKERVQVMELPADVDVTDVWAPEVHKYNGKYYLFTTLTEKKGARPVKSMAEGRLHAELLTPRGTWIFVADSPLGPFKPVKDGPIADPSFMTLDGTLYVEDNQPYMVYCHEWIQMDNGTIEYAPLSRDFTSFTAAPKTLLDARSAMKGAGNVTDGPFFYRSQESGTLYMIWSNFVDGYGYCVLMRRSASGKIAGPWSADEVLYGNHSGHGMILRTQEGRLMLVLHGPNDSPDERMKMVDVTESLK